MTASPVPVTFASANSYDPVELRPALERVFAPQLEAFGPVSGKKVLLKPNLLAWKHDGDIACVHPAFLVECAKLFLDAGAAHVDVMENPAVQTAPVILQAMGVAEELRRLGVKTANFADYQLADCPENVRFHNLELAAERLDYDCVADLAKAKTHSMMILTLCVKNLFGLVNGSSRMAWHLAVRRDFDMFADMLLDIYLTVKPQFNFLDAVVAMEGNGPNSGTPRDCRFLAGSPDSLALDAAVAPLFGVPDLPLLRRARERELIPELRIDGDTVDPMQLILPEPPGSLTQWGMPLPPFCRDFMREHLLSRPVLDAKLCVGCGLCAKLCPPQSLHLVEGTPRFKLDECIRCYCCQEHCPKGAITARETFAMKCVERLEKLLRGKINPFRSSQSR